jgi:3-methyladenine DNA glycosylase AlkD
MHKYHQEIARAINQRAAQENVRLNKQDDRYIGTTKPSYALKAAVVGEIVRGWIARHPDLTPADYRHLLDSLSRSKTHNEFAFIGPLLSHLPRLRKTLTPRALDGWLARAEGWAEVDCICQSNFTADELLANWGKWKRALIALSKSANVHERRASLVLLTKPVRDSADRRLAQLAFANIGRLKRDNHILITKAVSWLLRDLVKHHRAEVEAYLDAHANTLPKIVVRETRNKLVGGVKRKQRGVEWVPENPAR